MESLKLTHVNPNNGERGSFFHIWYWIHLHKGDGPRRLLCVTVVLKYVIQPVVVPICNSIHAEAPLFGTQCHEYKVSIKDEVFPLLE